MLAVPRRTTVAALVVSLVTGFVPLASRAAGSGRSPKDHTSQANVAKAEKAYKAALELYRNGQYRAAIDKLKEARGLDPGAKDLPYNLGLVYEKLGELDDAIEWFEVYVSMETDEGERERVKATIRRLEGARRDLQRSAASASASAPPPPPPRASASEEAPPPPPSAAPAAGRLDGWVYGTGGLAVTAALVGTFFGIEALSKKPSSPTTTRTTTIADLQKSADDAHRSAVIADVSFAVALLAGGAAAYLYFSRDAEQPSSSAAIVPLPGGAAGRVEITF